MRTGFLRLATGVASALAVAVAVGVIPPSGEATKASWRALPPAPVAGRIGASVVWTGREMIVWGGVTRTASGQASARSDGAAYNPRTRRWRRIASAPAGVELLVFGGHSGDVPATPTAAALNPAAGKWRELQALDAIAGLAVVNGAVWDGRQAIVPVRD